ncbi:MAG: PIN domain-containing protein [Mucilaginibacter sp.]|nr:PIN domain-containing protein [Mucilaginibacter sp.]
MAYKNIFIDSDILLDVFLNRYPHYESSADVLLLSDNRNYNCSTSVHALLNVHYIAKRSFGEKNARNAIKSLTERLSVVTEDIKIVDDALASDFSDFEDAVQYYAAASNSADVIITRNIKDYKQSTIPVLTAEQFLRTL